MNVTVTTQEVERLRDFVAATLGLYFGEDTIAQLATVFRERLHRTGCPSPSAYWDLLASAADAQRELRALAAELTVAETYFYRHPEQYKAFEEVALRERMRGGCGRRRLRVLSAGCASGEEAYSLAAIVRDCLGPAAAEGVDILGVDLNPLVLDKARRARYSAWSLRATGEDQRQRLFRCEGREFVLHDDLRTAVRFEERNLLKDDAGFWAPGSFDIVFCRNVMIYFAADTVKGVVARLSGALAPGGYLFLGPSETLRNVSQDFHLCHTHGAFYYRRRHPDEPPCRATIGDRVDLGGGGGYPSTVDAAGLLTTDDSWFGAIDKSSQRIATLAQRSRSPAPVAGRRAGGPLLGDARAPAAHDWNLAPARELLRRERFSDVMAALQALPPGSETDLDVLLLRAAVLTNGGNIGEAERVCLQVLAVDELNAGAHYLRALCREHAEDEGAAVEHDQIAAYLDPSFAMPRLHLGLMAQRRGDGASARGELRRALVLLAHEDPARVLLFGGGFSRDSLAQLCRSALRACGGTS